jgi:hypothetical protein
MFLRLFLVTQYIYKNKLERIMNIRTNQVLELKQIGRNKNK